MPKITIFFVFIFFTYHSISQETNPLIQIKDQFKNSKNQYQIDYLIKNSIECVSYDVKVDLYDKNSKLIPAFKLTGDFNSVKGETVNHIYWDVYKDRDDFPTIGKVEVKIIKINKPQVNVLIESSPSGAHVSFGDYNSGVTPYNLDIAEGDYKVVIQKDEYEGITEYVDIRLCEKKLFYTLKKIHYNLSLKSKPSSAEIYIDGAYISSTPKDLSVLEGRHKLKIEKQGFVRRQRTLTVDTTFRSKTYFLKPKTVFGIGCIGGNNTLGGEFMFLFSRIELDFSIMKTQPFIEPPYQNYTSLGYSVLLGYRIVYPIDFSLHAGLGLRVFTDKDQKSNSKNYYSLVTGITLPIYFSPKFGIYLKTDYWLKTESSDMFLFSGGFIWKI